LIFGMGSGGFSNPSKVRPQPGEPKGQLYNLDDDPAEQNNLHDQMPEKVAELTREFESVATANASRP
jgi:hypothetical protein